MKLGSAALTISSTTRKAGPYTGNGVQTVFAFAFKVFQASDVLVTKSVASVETVLALGVDYTVALNADQDAAPGGSITLVVALPNTVLLVVSSNVDSLQPVLVTNAGGFFPSVFNGVFDKLTILAQQLTEKQSRTLTASIFSPITNLNVPVLAGGVLQWSADGTALVAVTLPNLALSLALPAMAGKAGQYLTNDGVNTASWTAAAAANALTLNGAAGTTRVALVQTAGLNRWSFGANGNAEGGGNVGSGFAINRYDDTGALIDTPFSIARSNGLITTNAGLTLANGGLTLPAAGLAFSTGRGLVDNALAADLFIGTSASRAATPKSIADAQAFGALTDASTIAFPIDTAGNAASVTLTATGHTVGAPTISGGGLYDGCPVLLEIVQNATGGWTVVWNTIWDFGSIGTPTINTVALKATWVQGVYRSRSSKIHVNKVWQQA